MEWKDIDEAPKDGYPIWTKGDDWGDPKNSKHYQWAYWDRTKWMSQDLRGEGGDWLKYLTHYAKKNHE